MSLNKGLVFHAPLDKAHSKADNIPRFDGTNDYVTFSDSQELMDVGTSSISFWFRPEANGTNVILSAPNSQLDWYMFWISVYRCC